MLPLLHRFDYVLLVIFDESIFVSLCSSSRGRVGFCLTLPKDFIAQTKPFVNLAVISQMPHCLSKTSSITLILDKWLKHVFSFLKSLFALVYDYYYRSYERLR